METFQIKKSEIVCLDFEVFFCNRREAAKRQSGKACEPMIARKHIFLVAVPKLIFSCIKKPCSQSGESETKLLGTEAMLSAIVGWDFAGEMTYYVYLSDQLHCF